MQLRIKFLSDGMDNFHTLPFEVLVAPGDRYLIEDLAVLYAPSATVLIAAFDEEDSIVETIEGCLAIDYPEFEVVVVNDGSTDSTIEKVRPFVEAGSVRLIDKKSNEGKITALNQGKIPITISLKTNDRIFSTIRDLSGITLLITQGILFFLVKRFVRMASHDNIFAAPIEKLGDFTFDAAHCP